MIGKVATGLAALGLIGGVGHVVYNDHGAPTVNVKGSDGVTHTTTLPTNGVRFLCPDIAAERAALRPLTMEMGRIKITMQGVDKYTDRYQQLLDRFNADVDEYNARLAQDCTKH